MKLYFILISFLICSSGSISQDVTDSLTQKYPDGIYDDKEDFINGVPSRNLKVEFDLSDNNSRELVSRGYFKYTDTGKKVKNVFAISYNGDLYFQTGQIILPRNRNSKDGDQTSSTSRALQEFNKVMFINSRFAYTELILKSGWESAIAVNVGAQVFEYRKAVVWDYENLEFNIFRNCKDHNVFMEQNYPYGIQMCYGKSYDLRATMKAIMSFE